MVTDIDDADVKQHGKMTQLQRAEQDLLDLNTKALTRGDDAGFASRISAQQAKVERLKSNKKARGPKKAEPAPEIPDDNSPEHPLHVPMRSYLVTLKHMKELEAGIIQELRDMEVDAFLYDGCMWVVKDGRLHQQNVLSI